MHRCAIRRDDGDIVAASWITGRGAVARDARLLTAIDMLRADPALRLIAVLDDDDRPVGALLERDLRPLLFSPFGYALLSNRGLAIGLSSAMCACPVVEMGTSASHALQAWRTAIDAEGLIVTHGGRFAGVVDQPALLRVAATRDHALSRARIARADRIDRATRTFAADARDLASGLGTSSASLASASSRMTGRAVDIGTRSAQVAAAATQAAGGLREIGVRGRDFTASLGAVERVVTDARDATLDAVAQIGRGSEQVAALVDAANSIGSVTSLIDTIAQQTTMLALNAQMEAARAGASGAGFTAVAHEVKALADRTRLATADIAGQVGRLRGAIGDVSDGHAVTSAAMGCVETLSVAMTGTVREQGAAGRDIAAHVDEAGAAASAIGATMIAIVESVASADEDAVAMRAVADDLASRARAVEHTLSAFLADLQAA